MVKRKRNLRFRLISEQAELFSIAGEWQTLIRASAHPQPMNDPSWLLLWWRHYGAGVDLTVGMLYDGDVLVGLAPMCVRNYVYRLGLVFRRLQFMGLDANEQDGVCSEYMGFVARVGYDDDVAETFIDLIYAGQFGVWHELVLGAVSGDDATMSLAENALTRRGARLDRNIGMVAHYIKLPESWDSYLKQLSSTRRYRIKNSMTKFAEWTGGKEWKLEHARSAQSFREGYETLVALHGERWRSEGGTGAFASPRFTAFHWDYIAAQSTSGNVDLAWLKVGEKPVAVIYTIRNGKKVLAYQYGRVMDTPTRVRVGIVINAMMIKEAIERGDEEFDFLGGESRYKLDFATHQRSIVNLRVARTTAREFLRVGMVSARDGMVATAKVSRALGRKVFGERGAHGQASADQAERS